MKTTTNHSLKKPDNTDIVNIEDLNYNADKLDSLLIPVTTTTNGLMSSTDKTKLNGIATGANNYVHPTGDGNLHVPKNGTSNNGKVLTSGSTAGLLSWTSLPTTLPANGGNSDTVDGKHASDFAVSKTLPNGTDLNTIIEPGLYSCMAPINGPNGEENVNLLVLKHSNDEIVVQYANELGEYFTYYRYFYVGHNSTWTKMLTSYDVGINGYHLATINDIPTLTTTSKNGLMSYEDKVKLNGIATGATKTILNNTVTSTSTAEAATANAVKTAYDLAASKAASSHTHDDRYYTEAEINTKLAMTTFTVTPTTGIKIVEARLYKTLRTIHCYIELNIDTSIPLTANSSVFLFTLPSDIDGGLASQEVNLVAHSSDNMLLSVQGKLLGQVYLNIASLVPTQRTFVIQGEWTL